MGQHIYIKALADIRASKTYGFVTHVQNGVLVSNGPKCSLGDICEFMGSNSHDQKYPILGEAIKLSGSQITFVPLTTFSDIRPGDQVVRVQSGDAIPVGDEFSDRIVNGYGKPIDEKKGLIAQEYIPASGLSISAMNRAQPDTIFETGIRAIDGLLTLAQGQRIGVFAASGVGKTTLLQQIAQQSRYDHCVMCLVGERGREIEAFWKNTERDDVDQKRSCVAATSDESAVTKIRTVNQALCLAEYWRDQGKHVLLILDSITRYAMAMREIGLATGAVPSLRAYTTNVFEALPKVVERCGKSRNGGSITAIFSVLSETDDNDDPIVEAMKSLLDGHIILSRDIAEQGIFPAIDIPASISRLSSEIITEEQSELAVNIRSQLAAFEQSKILIESGVYKKGSNKALDTVLENRDWILNFLSQGRKDTTSISDSFALMARSLGHG